MPTNKINPKVSEYLSEVTQWQEEMEELRSILLDLGLTEEIKWGKPCYLSEGKNIVIIQGFKAYVALLFFKGVLLDDGKGILVKTGEKTHVGRQIRFTEVGSIRDMSATIKDYVKKAIEVEKAGLTIEKKPRQEAPIPAEFQQKLDTLPELKSAFENLTPGRKKAYIHYFSDAKQSKTRIARIEKYIDKILSGKGMMD
ncbi:YdeI family protein [Listeria sp. PSOL-1]|uniref:YdeI/OmpD-associated family protein n=1 Tax=Listeria sp. PSOL-1 TaxID=1844999 RepID=UPI0013D50636|nr:YdeI/OmpD-associated family protein [Listeria sp. PSOL-1]